MGRRSYSGGRGLATLLLALFLGGRAGLAAAPDARPFTVVCSFYPMYVMALNVVGDTPGVSVECLTASTVGCLHDYQLTPGNLKTLGKAQVFIANGAGMESFTEKVVQQSPNLRVIVASRGLKLAYHNNPHIWVSISGAMGEVSNIAQGLAAADPPHAAAYQANAGRYLTQLDQLRGQMHAALDGLKHREIITFHEAFPYFAQEFGLKVVGVVEREPGSHPSAGELARTIELVRKEHGKALGA